MQLQIILIKINQIQRNNYWVFSLTCVENSRFLYRYIKPFVTCQEDLAKLQFSAPSAPWLRMRPRFLKLVLPHNMVMSTELRACAHWSPQRKSLKASSCFQTLAQKSQKITSASQPREGTANGIDFPKEWVHSASKGGNWENNTQSTFNCGRRNVLNKNQEDTLQFAFQWFPDLKM